MLDDAIEEIAEKIEEAEKTYKQKNVIEGEEKDQKFVNAQEMRERALESFVIKTQRTHKKRRERPKHLG